MGKRNHTHCERCSKPMTSRTRFGDSPICIKCVESCTDCGISLTDKNRCRNQCTSCFNNDGYKGSCCMCGVKVHHFQYIERGNWCLKCERKVLQRHLLPEETLREKEGRNYITELIKIKYKNTCTVCGKKKHPFDKRGFHVVLKNGGVRGSGYIRKKDVEKLTLMCIRCSRKKLSTVRALQQGTV